MLKYKKENMMKCSTKKKKNIMKCNGKVGSSWEIKRQRWR